ncbi:MULTISPECIES: DUF29 domain-containing protein [Cyanophyceae]|uniref:DUF29 domain-containing protein n=1 Tax=Cyanophyceae TaxID=3028117 RepID=UPI001685B1FB|nr:MULTISPECIES: DUF29 domain-containing protein [Cyanophyceae]MBD1916832.1 DUF29 domain-containing protein [Phormidium sp. FACHB-77]MBD2029463.1 DUF29 domain-containing protein [Phormidium sp. FACHB-322]MBD2052039.1 DUF29 domain-containing protein [Leptolyngbya sp. FACHB-60]
MASLYETDFYAWTQQQTKLLEQNLWEKLDLPHLVEELQDLGRRERQELRNRLSVLLGHLLKWQYQPEQRGNSWRATIREQRTQVQLVLSDNPSLKPYLAEALAIAYQLGQDLAVQETGLDYSTFSADCPYTLAQILDQAFFPSP